MDRAQINDFLFIFVPLKYVRMRIEPSVQSKFNTFDMVNEI